MTVVLCLSLSLMLLSGPTEAASRHRRQQPVNISSPDWTETNPLSREYNDMTLNMSDYKDHAESAVHGLNSSDNTATDSPCGMTYCDLFDLCNSDEICMTSPPPECRSSCWRNGSEVTESTPTTEFDCPQFIYKAAGLCLFVRFLSLGQSDMGDHTSSCATVGITGACKPRYLSAARPGDPTTLRPREDRTCVHFPGLICIHGTVSDCNDQTFSCLCDAGWTGFFCDEACTLPCVYGDCAVTGTGRMFCSCEHTHTGELCDERLLDTQEAVPPEDTVTLQPEDIRTCHYFPGIICQHGVAVHCDEDPEGFRCLCDAGWIGIFCDEACTLPCVHGECTVAGTGHMFCSCESTHRGELCDELLPVPRERRRIMKAIFSTALAVVVVILIIAIPVIMWRLRVIPILKFIYMFKHYEDEDGKEFDAYVSMTSTASTEKFVYWSLQPILEDHKFKLFLQSSDCPTGEVMSEAILTALEKSRRIIMVITPDYITNEWTRFKYLIAKHGTLNLHQRIIPIILEDVDKESVNMDKSLKRILDSIKCLKYPTAKLEPLTPNTVEISDNIHSPGSNKSLNSTTSFCKSGRSSSTDSVTKEEHKFERKAAKFWKRLVLSMPKKKSQKNTFPSFLPRLRKETKYEINPINCEDKPGYMGCSNPACSEFNFKINIINDLDNDAFCTKSGNPCIVKNTTEVRNKEIECQNDRLISTII